MKDTNIVSYRIVYYRIVSYRVVSHITFASYHIVQCSTTQQYNAAHLDLRVHPVLGLLVVLLCQDNNTKTRYEPKKDKK